MIGRRSFIAASLAAPALLRAANRLNVGIGTYTYHNYSLDDMIGQLQ